MILWSLFCCLACTFDAKKDREKVDELNRMSYALRYKNVVESRQKADDAYNAAQKLHYQAGVCEALCNKAFYALARMQYSESEKLLSEASGLAPDNISKLNVEVLHMRLCQRRSANKEFYVHKFKAQSLIKSIGNNRKSLTQKERDMFVFSCSEYSIVLSAYLYYVNKKEESSEVLLSLSDIDDFTLQSDTAQWLSYLYNVGAGGVLKDTSKVPVSAQEFEYLMQCYLLASHSGYIYWEANALQGLSEHLNNKEKFNCIQDYNAPSIRYLKEEGVEDSLLSKVLAQKSLDLFVRYGDVYQTSGAWRTLSDTYYRMGDFEDMLNCLEKALEDSSVYQAPDLVASIDERLCIAYSARGDKYMADVLRNEFLDIQDSTRQDRQLEARKDAINEKISVLNSIVLIIICAIVVLCLVFATLIYYRKKKGFSKSFSYLSDQYEELTEQYAMLELKVSDERRLGVEHHAKASFVQSMQPLVDRMLHAVQRVSKPEYDNEHVAAELRYMQELCNSISEGNQLLTNWIQLRKGNVRLKVETFAISDLFDVVRMNEASFASKGIQLNVPPCDISIKADRVLTLFLVNTIVDNARKYTPSGGSITLECIPSEEAGYADISVTDTGCGMPEDVVEHLFEYHVIEDSKESLEVQKSHGFGLMNCRGIIDRYRKTSELFRKTEIFAESRVGEGTKITFRLPQVVKSLLLLITFSLSVALNVNATDSVYKQKAAACCDSMYNCNVNGRYEDALAYGESCRQAFNDYYLSIKPTGIDTLTLYSGKSELLWWNDSLDVDFRVILSMRNETAVAALSLHKWKIYEDNNEAYIKLYSVLSTDETLDAYISNMQKYETLADYAFIVLAIIIFSIFAIFYRLYLRDFFFEKRSLKQRITQLREDIAVKELEFERMYASNSVMENCLSTIKHETMYYPSRILRLLDEALKSVDLGTSQSKENVDILISTVEYYRTLYIILASHCQNLLNDGSLKPQTVSLASIREKYSNIIDMPSLDEVHGEIRLLGDEYLLEFLFVILKRLNKDTVTLNGISFDERHEYVTLKVACHNVQMNASQANNAFQLQTQDVNNLLIRQILREIGNATSRYSTGVNIRRNSSDTEAVVPVTVEIVLPVVY